VVTRRLALRQSFFLLRQIELSLGFSAKRAAF